MHKKKIIVCCDGTWNHPGSQTNVFRTYTHLRAQLREGAREEISRDERSAIGEAADGTPVALHYVSGVGTAPLGIDHVIGGATGFGLSFNVQKAYRFIANHYAADAELYVFGFSRGAYTARSLCGFIHHSGVLESPSIEEVAHLYYATYATPKALLDQGAKRAWKDRLGRLVDDGFGAIGRALRLDTRPADRRTGVKIRFLGVYDTVGALGIPLPATAQANEALVGFHDTAIGAHIEHAVHALAIDERRGPYVPTLWTLPPDGALAPGQTVLQVWFPGVHSDVGGGYTEHREIGDRALAFMLGEAVRRGLPLDLAKLPAPVAEPPAQHESYDDTWEAGRVAGFLADGTRRIDPASDAQGRPIAGRMCVHPMVGERRGRPVHVYRTARRQPGSDEERDVPVSGSPITWTPANLPDTLPVLQD